MSVPSEEAPSPVRDAATIIVVRPCSQGIEIFCVERNKNARFMGGAVVFPGGKLDAHDEDPSWRPLLTSVDMHASYMESFVRDEDHFRALAIAAARETLEEAAILPVRGARPTHEELLDLRRGMISDATALRTFLRDRGALIDLGALLPIGRWITPIIESRRFDARFFVMVAPEGQLGAHDDQETMSSFWATPAEILERFGASTVKLMPPTHRMVSLLADCGSLDDVMGLARRACLAPVCPKLVEHRDDRDATLALVLPGDPEHDIGEVRVPGPSRYVRRGDRWLPEDPPRR